MWDTRGRSHYGQLSEQFRVRARWADKLKILELLMNALRLLMFSLLFVAFLPLFILGVIGFIVRLMTRNRGISTTAYEPFFSRLLFHHAGTRDDHAAV